MNKIKLLDTIVMMLFSISASLIITAIIAKLTGII